MKTKYAPGTRVAITDSRGTHYGTVRSVVEILPEPNKMLVVRWDSGVSERIHPSEVDIVQPAADPGS